MNVASKYRLRKGEKRLQVLVTHRCNAVCEHCDKAVGLARFPDLEMTAWDMKKAVRQARKYKLGFRRVTLSGGEPVVNKQLQGIINEVAMMPGMRLCRVLSNDLEATKEKRDKIKFPDKRFAWFLAPLDNTSDPKSGKNEKGIRYKDHIHLPYWISPADLGIESKFEWCGNRKFCGRGYDNKGYTMCGQAPILGRILGIDPYPKKGANIKDHIDKPVPEICKHCIYGLKKQDLKQLRMEAYEGRVQEMTETYSKVFGSTEKELVQLTL